MSSLEKHIIRSDSSIEDALVQLNELSLDALLIVVDNDGKLVGSLTDGDIRRTLLKQGFESSNEVKKVLQKSPKFIKKNDFDLDQVIKYRNDLVRILPVLDDDDKVIKIINFRKMKSYLPVDALIMAGGKGSRLLPITKKIPKPLLKIGDKSVIEHNLDRLALFGIDDFWISVNYLGEQIEKSIGNGQEKNLKIEFVYEDEPLGTIAAAGKIANFKHDYVLITNSDILTNMDYEQFFLDCVRQDADMAIATVPYEVGIPYAVLNTSNNRVLGLEEKPTYTYYSNAGIYLVKKSILDDLNVDGIFHATDLITSLIKEGKNVHSYPLTEYWLDVGSHSDFERANKDIKNLKF